MTNQEAYLSVKRALASVGNSSGKDSDGEALENQSFIAIEGPEKYNFLALVAFEEYDDENSGNKSDTQVDVELNDLEFGTGCDNENVEMMAGTDPAKEDGFLQETKVSFKHAKKNMHNYSKTKLESLSLVKEKEGSYTI